MSFKDVFGYLRNKDTGKLIHREIAYKNYTGDKGKFSNLVVHHKDGNKLNNSSDNLKPMTSKEHEFIHVGKDETGGFFILLTLIVAIIFGVYYFLNNSWGIREDLSIVIIVLIPILIICFLNRDSLKEYFVTRRKETKIKIDIGFYKILMILPLIIFIGLTFPLFNLEMLYTNILGIILIFSLWWSYFSFFIKEGIWKKKVLIVLIPLVILLTYFTVWVI